MNETPIAKIWSTQEALAPPIDLSSVDFGAPPISGWRGLVKDCIDRGGAAALILFMLPLFLILPVLIRLDSPGPILFTQWRYGRGCRRFKILKFRTLKADQLDPGGVVQVGRLDARVTRVGRFLRTTSLDEIPQLINVLTGDMSLVGPRPHPTEMRTEGLLGEEISPRYLSRHSVKPGMTGLAQVRGRRGSTRHARDLLDRLELDLEYVSRWSLALDLKILLATPVALLLPTAME